MKKLLLLTCLLFFIQLFPRKNAIIIGATSGMGRATAKLLANDNYTVGLAGRRTKLLKSLQKEISTESFIKSIDVSKTEVAMKQLEELIDEMRGIDLILISISAYDDDKTAPDWKNKEKMIRVDAMGVWAMAEVALQYFKKQKSGHLVAISSISGLRGSAQCPVYCGSKAFVQKYLEGVRNYMSQNNLPIHVTDIVPGWVDNERHKYSKMPHTYWVTQLEQAAKDIFEAIKKKKKVAYISKRQIFVAWALALVPDYFFNWMGEF